MNGEYQALNDLLLEPPLAYDTLSLAYYEDSPLLQDLLTALRSCYTQRQLPSAHTGEV